VKPYYSDDHVTLYHGDAREVLLDIDIDIDVVVTDPPYGIGWNSGGMAGSRDHPDIVGDDSTLLAEWIIEYAAPAPMVVFGANHFPHALPTPGQWICWDKRVSESADRMFGSAFELAWKSGPDKAAVMYRILHGGVVNADGPGRRPHPTAKPVKLIRRIIEDLLPADGLIVDPFAGAGSTLRAAKDLGRRSVGVEVVEEYCDAAARRCAQEVLAI